MDHDEAEAYATAWAADWNSHDLERILSHYTEDVVWSSPGIVRFLGDPNGTLRGKEALREYFAAGLKQLPDLRFTVERVHTGVGSVVIGYRNQAGQQVSEVLMFRDGLVREGFGAYGAAG